MEMHVDTLFSLAEGEVNNEEPTFRQLQLSLLELAEVKHALETSQQQLNAAQQQLEKLVEANALLRQRSILLAKRCAEARHNAYHDPLTGLPNRNLLLDRLKQAMARSDRQHKQLALLFIDLDKFKSINDRFGHIVGDKVLQQVAKRLAACIRYGDTACRYAGDEFVIMLPEIDGQENVAAVIEKIRDCLTASLVVEGHVLVINASIGIAVYCADGQNCNDLIKQADRSMYLAKAQNKTSISIAALTDSSPPRKR